MAKIFFNVSSEKFFNFPQQRCLYRNYNKMQTVVEIWIKIYHKLCNTFKNIAEISNNQHDSYMIGEFFIPPSIPSSPSLSPWQIPLICIDISIAYVMCLFCVVYRERLRVAMQQRHWVHTETARMWRKVIERTTSVRHVQVDACLRV